MKQFLNRNRYLLLLFILFLLAEFIVNPLGEFPLNDDWSYAKTVLIMIQEGDIYIGSWCAMTLASHAVWGFLFVKLFGFSFIVLRFSTLVSSLIGIATLYKLVFSISKNQTLAFVTGLTLLFNPLYFNLSNTYMTDVNFNTWLILAFYFAYSFFETRKPLPFALVFFISAALVLNRQFGILLPVGFTSACLLLSEKKWRYVILAAIGTLGVFAIFKWYEAYVYRVLPGYSAYVIFNTLNLTDAALLKRIGVNIIERYKLMTTSLLVYVSPLAFIWYRSFASRVKPVELFAIVLVSLFVFMPALVHTQFPNGNIFTNMALGPETFYYSSAGSFSREKYHTYSALFDRVLVFSKYLLSLVSTTALTCYLYCLFRKRNPRNPSTLNPFKTMIVVFSIIYFLALCVSISFFDRYIIPIISVVLLLIGSTTDAKPARVLPGFIILVLFAYVSVFGTKDYLTLNRARWEAVNTLKSEKGVGVDRINAGFEVNHWHNGDYVWMVDYTKLDTYDYLVQYDNEPGFRFYKAFEFQRYFPYRKDKLNIFVRDTLK